MKIKLYIFFLSSILLSSILYAQDQNPELTQQLSQSSSTATVDSKKIKDLQNITLAIKELEKSIDSFSNDVSKASSKGLASEIEIEIKNKNERLKKLKSNLNEIASGIEVDEFDIEESNQKIDWISEVQDLLSPLLNEVKRLTNRPRELDKLHRKISLLSEHSKKSEVAIENINNLIKQSNSKDLIEELQNINNSWNERKHSLIADISVLEQRLNQLKEENASIYSSLKQIPNLFLRSRGRNLIIAIVSTFIFWWLVKVSYFKLKQSPLMVSPSLVDYRRAVNLFYLCFSGSGSLTVFLFVLFALGDWVLLILSFMLLVGVIWTSKHAFPHFWNQGTLLLNVGPVREGEVVVLNNVLWEVESLNIYVTLRNPELQPSTIRVPLNDFFQIRSRPLGIGEKYFPTKVGDWILFDGRLAQVITQTPDSVTVFYQGGSNLTVSTSSFIGMNPELLSLGFRVSSVFGLDYEYQHDITDAIPKMISENLNCELKSRIGSGSYSVFVEFDSASESSLNININVDIDGRHASEYDKLRRLIQRVCVEMCNKNKWLIPYPQLTVHLENKKV